MSIRGWFVWEELMTTDTAAAAAFYGKIAPLKTAPAAFEPAYTTLVSKAGHLGGLMTLPEEARAGGAPPCWMSYIGTPDAEETARQAAALGGTVVKAPWTIAEGGRIAILSDPQGATFAIYSNPKAGEPPPAPGLGQASWHELATTDYAAAFSFYQRLFGWHVVSDMDMGPQGTYRLFAPDGMKEAIGGIYTKTPQQPGPAWLPYIKVADVRPATEKARALGAQIMHGPADVPGGMITMAMDPQGVMFALHHTGMAAAAPAAKKPAVRKATKKAPKKTKTKAKTKKKSAKPARKKAAPKRRATPVRKAPARRRAGAKK